MLDMLSVFFSFLISERIPEFLKEEMMQLQDSDDKPYEDLATGEDLEFLTGQHGYISAKITL